MSYFYAIDVLPSVRPDETKLIRTCTYNWAWTLTQQSQKCGSTARFKTVNAIGKAENEPYLA